MNVIQGGRAANSPLAIKFAVAGKEKSFDDIVISCGGGDDVS
jgi:hypothetical protein